MKPNISVEFVAKAAGQQFEEESVTFQSPEELFSYVAPGGGCDKIPDEVDEIQMLFMSSQSAAVAHPLAEQRVTLQMGMVFFTGPLSVIIQTAQQIMDKAGRGELSKSFLAVVGE